MTTTAPAPTTCDTQDMIVVHRLFRRLFQDGPELVRRVRVGDDDHRHAVVDHLLHVCSALHGHHRTEDEHLWDRLSAKAPGCAIHVHLMRRQHAAVGDRLDAAESVLTRWWASDDAVDQAAAETAMDSVLEALLEHLGDEERRILPEAAKALTQKEWNVLGEVARKEKPNVPDFVQQASPWVQLGLMLEGLDEQQRVEVRRILPAPAIVLYSLLGTRKFAAYHRRLWGSSI